MLLNLWMGFLMFCVGIVMWHFIVPDSWCWLDSQRVGVLGYLSIILLAVTLIVGRPLPR